MVRSWTGRGEKKRSKVSSVGNELTACEIYRFRFQLQNSRREKRQKEQKKETKNESTNKKRERRK